MMLSILGLWFWGALYRLFCSRAEIRGFTTALSRTTQQKRATDQGHPKQAETKDKDPSEKSPGLLLISSLV